MSWNYRILKHTKHGEDYYLIHEVYYDDDGKPWGWTQSEGKVPFGETPEELINVLEMMLKDAKKSINDIIDFDSTPEGKSP